MTRRVISRRVPRHAPGERSGAAEAGTRTPGVPLEPVVRAKMEHRFGADFSQVRVHADRTGTGPHDYDAYTVGDDIVLGPGRFAPNVPPDQRLLAHELAHVVQQRMPARTSLADAETEADRVADRVVAGRRSAVRHGVGARVPQYSRVRVRGRVFEVGEVRLHGRAVVDVRTFGVLFPGPDQAHVLVHGNQLGYEVSHAHPDDPFRWSQLKEFVDAAAVDIFAVGRTDPIQVTEVRAGQQPRVVRRALYEFGASGITLPSLSVAMTTARAGAAAVIASPVPGRHRIYYESGQSGRGSIGSNSLAHELFGHLWLAHKGVPHAHGQQLTAAHAVTDPFGRRFVGGVDEYIARFAGASTSALQSPTQHVGRALMAAAERDFQRAATAPGGLTRGPGNSWGASDAVGLAWERLGNNFDVLAAPPPGPPGPEADALVARIVATVRTFNADQRFAFDNFLRALLVRFGITASRRTRLAQAVQTALAVRQHPRLGPVLITPSTPNQRRPLP